jgi:signal peptidase I
MSDRFGWDPAGEESPEESNDADQSPGGWPQDEPEPEEDRGEDWPSSGATWQQRDYGEGDDYGYVRREELFSNTAEVDRLGSRQSRDPLARLFPGLPRGLRVTLDWILTIAGAILIVLALKQWVVNPYRIPSSSMEPTLNCAKPALGCLGDSSDRVLACRICLDFRSPSRNDIVVFNTPSEAAAKCGEGGTFVKRVIGLPGEIVHEDHQGFISVKEPGAKRFVKLKEPFISAKDRLADGQHFGQTWPKIHGHVEPIPPGNYLMMGDNRSQSCDSRTWGTVPRDKLIGIVFFVYWPPDRIGFR